MSSLTHPKFHRHNHHTISVNTSAYPDVAHDPIASYDSPFIGDFVCDGKIVSTDENINFNFKHNNLALFVSSSNVAVSAIGDALFNGNLSTDSITFNKEKFTHAEYITTTSISKYWIVYVNDQPYGVRLWSEPSQITINGSAPYFLQQTTTEYVLSGYPDAFANIAVGIRGTYPISIQWYKDSENTKIKSFKVLNLNPTILTITPSSTNTTYEWSSASISNPTETFVIANATQSMYRTKHPGYYHVLATTNINNQYVPSEDQAILLSREPGVYRCVASNIYGSVTSVNITVTDPSLD